MTTEKNIRRVSNTIGKVFKIMLIANEEYLKDWDFNVKVSNDWQPEASIEFGIGKVDWKVLEPLSQFFIDNNITWSIHVGEDGLTKSNAIILKFSHDLV